MKMDINTTKYNIQCLYLIEKLEEKLLWVINVEQKFDKIYPLKRIAIETMNFDENIISVKLY